MSEAVDEMADLKQLIGDREPKPVIRGFDTAALFLLDLNYTNLFEPTDARPGASTDFRCKGCRRIVPAGDRQKHHASHVRARNAGQLSQGGTKMATDASKKKPTAKEQGFPSAYLAANGNFKPGLDARAKSDLFAAVLDLDTSKALHKFEKPDAARLIKARGWEPLLEKKRQTIAAEAERAEKRKAERAEATKNAATSKASGRKTASVSSVGQAKPDPKPKRKAPATRQPGSRKKTASRGSVRRVK